MLSLRRKTSMKVDTLFIFCLLGKERDSHEIENVGIGNSLQLNEEFIL